MSFFNRLFRSPDKDRQPAKAPVNETNTNTLVSIEMNEDGDVTATTFLPDFRSEKEFHRAAKGVATLLFLLNGGRLLSVLQESVFIGGAMDDKEALARAVIGNLNGMLAELAGVSTGLVVDPTSAFQSGG